MSTTRGYSGKPKHETQKRVYKPCAKCGKSTRAHNGICDKCKRRRRYIVHKKKRKAKVKQLTDNPQPITLESPVTYYGLCDICDEPATYKGPYDGLYCDGCKPKDL